MYFILKYLRAIFFVFCPCILLFTGCAVEKPMVPPYRGRIQQQAAMGYPKKPQAVPAGQQTTTSLQKSENNKSVSSATNQLLPVLTRINERIFSYEQKIALIKNLQASIASLSGTSEKQEKLAACQQRLEDILDRYNDLHQQFLRRDSVTPAELFAKNTLFALEKDDFALLEGDCGKLLVRDHPERTLVPINRTMLEEKKQAVSSAYTAGDYKKTINEYEQLTASLPSPPPYELTYAYARALMKTGREKESRKVVADLLHRIRRRDQAQWEFKLMQLLGDLDFALGAYEPAKKQYSEIVSLYHGLAEKNEWAEQQLAALNVADQQSEEVRAYAELLRSYLAYNPERDGYTVVNKAEAYLKKYPYSLVASSADQLVNISRKAADDWYGKLMKQVDKLAGQKRYQDALLVIERVPRLILPVDKQQELAVKAEKLRTTEAINRESTVLAQEQQAQENWNTAMTALAEKEYDRAIEYFTKVLGTSYDDRARRKIDEAANLAARDDRHRAAELFVRSGRTHDLWSRKKLLLASRKLLQDILIKYPQSDIISKVQRNLKRIDEEINNIDPGLLSAPMTVGDGKPQVVEHQTDTTLQKQGRTRELPPAQAVKSNAVRE